MECFISNDDDRILLVGEGNFSFSLDLVYYAEKYFGKFFSHDEKYKIIPTCFELENKISSIALLNANLLREKGIQVEFGIDARCLEQYAFLADEVHRQRPAFTRVIFNFPHVGGKMRIERNRKLLRDFLMSASQVLQPDGVVCVSLCAGQGGSTAENGVRRWDDSWKAVEAAGEADMLLTAVLPFPSADVLQQYASTGYRGLQKGFHFTDARVHVFCAATTPLPTPLTAEQLDNLLTRSSNNQTQYHADKILKNPWRKSSSVQSKFLDKFISITNLKLIDKIVVYDDFDYQSHGKETLLRCLQVNQLTNDFSLAPVECVLELFCKDAFGFALTTLKKLMKGENLSTFIILRSDCNVTILVDRMLDGDWRKLWTNGVTCVSPREYTLDVTFSVREILNEEKLVDVLWAVGGDFIVNVQLLSEFVFGEGAKRNYCYRIVYMSYDLPLFRARVIGIHNEVVSKAVEYHLNASVV